MIDHIPPKIILQRYARVLVNFALNSGRGLKKDEVVHLTIPENAKPLFVAIRNQVILSGGHLITNYLPINVNREFYRIANDEQIKFFPAKYYRGLVNQIDHVINIISVANLHELEKVDPQKITDQRAAHKPLKDWLDKREHQSRLSWTVALYGTSAMAQEAGMNLEDYWNQIVRACFLNYPDPISKWKSVTRKNNLVKKRLNSMKIDRLHIEGKKIDLWVKIGPQRKWVVSSGQNIPSFEVFISPDWRGTNGVIEFNQPLYWQGNMISGIKLEFKNGQVIRHQAQKNGNLLAKILSVDNANKLGEFSLTDKRLSKIDRFMASTLYDENISGPFGNTHIALGSAYKDSYPANPSQVNKATWKKLGYNDSAIHTDMVSTTNRTVTAHLVDGSKKIIYANGIFVL